MAGHSKFANIKHRKGAQDKKRAKIFTKLGREIVVAAKSGQPDPQFNPRLRAAIAAARAGNMPNDKIDAAIKRGSGPQEGETYEEVRYEGYGPGGIALIVEALTDNRNRAAADIRTIFNKNGGSMGESGSVAYMFERVGFIEYPADKAGEEAMFEAVIEAGADNCESSDVAHEITCDPDNFNEVRDVLAEKFGDAEVGRLSWKPLNTIDVTDVEQAQKILRLIDALEDNDDVQYVVANYDVPDDVAEQLELE